MRRSATELASSISRALLTASSQMRPDRAWTPSLEKTLHQLGCRDSLSPNLVARIIDPFLLNHHSLAFGFFNWASQQPGFIHTSVSCQSVLKSLSISRQFNSIDKVLKLVRAQKVILQPSVYRSVIASLISGRRTLMAFSLFYEARPVIMEIGPQVSNSLLAALSADGGMNSARKVFDEMIKRGVPLSTLGFGVFVWWACQKMGLNEILCLLDDVRMIGISGINGSIVALLVVHALCVESRTKDAVIALEELRKRECKPDFMAYRIVAEKLREIGSVVDVETVLKKKRKLGVAPRANDYRELILQLVSEGLMREAKDLGKMIVSGNFPIEDDVLNVLIGSTSAVDPLQAISFLRFMLEKEISPALLTVINLSENLYKHEKGDELVVEVFQLLSMKEYFANLETYKVMVSFLCKVGRVKECYEVLQEMKKKGLSPDVSFYNFLLEACCREDLVRPTKRLWDEMFANHCRGNLESYNILIKKFSELGQVEDACRLLRHMFENGLQPNESTYTSLLQGLCQAKNLEMALQVFNKSVEQDVTLANTVLSTFLVCLCKGGFLQSASKLLRGLTSGVGSVESHLILLRYLVDIGELSLATEHVQWVTGKSPALLHAIQTESPALFSVFETHTSY